MTISPQTQHAPGLIALVGGDEFGPLCTFDQEIISRTHPPMISLLPTAATFERPDRAIERGTQYFRSLGVDVHVVEIYERSDAFDDAVVASLAEAALLYCIGGSPLHLRSVMSATPALDAIKGGWSRGMTLVASSASAMAFGDPMIDPRGGALTIGLGIIGSLAVLPHADQRSEAIRERTIHLVHAPVAMVEIDAQTAVIYDRANGIEVLGQGQAHAYQNGLGVELSVIADLLDKAVLTKGESIA